MMINIALSSNIVKTIINNKGFIIQSIDLERQAVYFGIGEPYYLHQINVGIDLTNNTITGEWDQGNMLPPPHINNSSL
jgi:hypothetical protein